MGSMDSAELLQVVDERGRPVRAATREECHSDPSLIHRSVCVLLYRADGRLLLQLRSRSKDLYAGMWDLSATGHPRAGEAVESAARRELLEELGVEAGLERVGTALVRAPRETELAEVYRCRHAGPVHPDPGEIAAVAFHTPRAARQVPDLTPYAAALLAWLGDRGRR
jgi:isopentenyldiphosphate isomerase